MKITISVLPFKKYYKYYEQLNKRLDAFRFQHGSVSTISKRADKHDMENYHLISLKRIICKF